MKVLIVTTSFLIFNFNLYSQDFGKFNLADDVSNVPLPDKKISTFDDKKSSIEKEWTVMVFMNSKNDLEEYGIQDINEMERVGSTSKVNVVVEMGRIKGEYDNSNGDWGGVRRYFIKNDLLTDPLGKKITSPVVEDLGSVNMGDYREVIKFVKWAKNNYPAKKYLLILWNHGSGWIKDEPVIEKGISYDEETGNNIDTPQLGKIIKEVGKIDILASDACLMQMAEIAYEVKDGVDYLVGSEETEPGEGYSYYKILFPLSVDPSMDAETLAKIIVLAYWQSNLRSKSLATHSVLKLSNIQPLISKMDAFARAAIASGEKEIIRSARDSAQRYVIDDNKDLKHFVDLVGKKSSNASLKKAAFDLSSFLGSGEFIIENKTNISSNSNGIAVYVPQNYYDNDYNEIRLSKDTMWDEFLKWLIKK